MMLFPGHNIFDQEGTHAYRVCWGAELMKTTSKRLRKNQTIATTLLLLVVVWSNSTAAVSAFNTTNSNDQSSKNAWSTSDWQPSHSSLLPISSQQSPSVTNSVANLINPANDNGGSSTIVSNSSSQSSESGSSQNQIPQQVGKSHSQSKLWSEIMPLVSQAASVAAQRYGNRIPAEYSVNRMISNCAGRYANVATPFITGNAQSAKLTNCILPGLQPSTFSGRNEFFCLAQQAESRGDWYEASMKYSTFLSGATDISPADMQAGDRNHTCGVTEMRKRVAGDSTVTEAGKHMVLCNMQIVRDAQAGKRTTVNIGFASSSIEHAYSHLQWADQNNPAWSYLLAVYWCTNPNTMEYNHKLAMQALMTALKCNQISPSLKAKCLALKQHILPAFILQIKDTERQKMEEVLREKDNYEHPTITYVVDRDDRNRLVDVWDSRTGSLFDYATCKQILQDRPAMVKDFNSYVRYCQSLPNTGIPVPPGDANDEVATYCPAGWEQTAFGPLLFNTGL